MKRIATRLLMLIAACMVLQACCTRRVATSKHDESRYNASRTEFHFATDSTANTGTETTTLLIEFDTGGTMTVPQGWLEGIIAGVVNGGDTTAADTAKHYAQGVTIPRVKTIAAQRTKRTEQTATTVSAGMVKTDTTAQTVADADSTGTSVGQTAITGKPPNRFSWWLAGVVCTLLVAVGILIWLMARRQKNR
jgi:hypothetical protein